jgi:hypothetical protein
VSGARLLLWVWIDWPASGLPLSAAGAEEFAELFQSIALTTNFVKSPMNPAYKVNKSQMGTTL